MAHLPLVTLIPLFSIFDQIRSRERVRDHLYIKHDITPFFIASRNPGASGAISAVCGKKTCFDLIAT